MQNDRFSIEGIAYSSSDDEKYRKYIVTLVINTTNTVFENNLPLIEDLIKVTTILKEELNTKNFDINLKIRLEQKIQFGYYQKKSKKLITLNIL
ncbi:hypothetical protein ICM_01724 [Bacillus cereus BAG1X2-3]|nr:hypothetical protein ICC_03093 [Bacillus cereus BAG1X1-1]EOO49768.1 hypothetical protein ICI_02286 [Bacillus cereus BAG1X2-1]EOO51864.1 hypothetical protein ICK_03064 [Bacillus cereus BAG1X2-2]EOO60070.1 hypothetical protein ICM_01724 [Bacillus cereus BAG1X2-3]EOP06687.1 hypothetical protein ICO_02286 [Bacillus cereus BAG2O-1]